MFIKYTSNINSLLALIFFLTAMGSTGIILIALYFAFGVADPRFLFNESPVYEPMFPLTILIAFASAWLSPMGRALEYSKLALLTLIVANGLATALALLILDSYNSVLFYHLLSFLGLLVLWLGMRSQAALLNGG